VVGFVDGFQEVGAVEVDNVGVGCVLGEVLAGGDCGGTISSTVSSISSSHCQNLRCGRELLVRYWVLGTLGVVSEVVCNEVFNNQREFHDFLVLNMAVRVYGMLESMTEYEKPQHKE
jgi:hypothetical protein